MLSHPVIRNAIGAIFLALAISPAKDAIALDTLGNILTKNGYGGAQLIHPGNFYALPIQVNGKRGNLFIDTGSPATLIFRSSLNRLNLKEFKTNSRVLGAFGLGRDVFGIADIKTLIAGNCRLTNVPVEVAEGGGSRMAREPRSNGLFGLRELSRFGAVLDLQTGFLYLRPSPPSKKITAEIRSILLAKGCISIGLLNLGNHLFVDGALNGVHCRFIVDTGSYLTLLNQTFVSREKLKLTPTPFVAEGLNGSSSVEMVIFPSLRIGNYEIRNGSASVSRLTPRIFGPSSGIAGLIGIEYLALNHAVFDFSDNMLYLKPQARSF